MKKLIHISVVLLSFQIQAQVGINTTNPGAQLDIRSSNQATPSNTDGILIPKVDAFPVTNPTAAQQGMLVYLTSTSGTDLPGFYYWDNATVDWKPIAGTSLGALDQAYDFGGPGLGRTITADAGAVLINGTDGLVSTGTSGSGALAPSGAGTKMFWNPRKAAFRVGRINGTQWDDSNIGISSVAFGESTTASGFNSTAFGNFSTASAAYSTVFGDSTTANGLNSTAFGDGTIASGVTSTAFGFESTASGNFSTVFGDSTTASALSSTAFGSNTIASAPSSTAFGNSSVASGITSTAFGFDTTASGTYSTVFGSRTTANGVLSTAFGTENTASSYAETVLGIGATSYLPSTNGTTQFRTANATDRLFVIGNAIDANNNTQVDIAERSDAMIVLKNGLTRLPSTTNAMITAADGKAVVTKEYLQSNTSGTLDQAYDFGGAGIGRTITADAGAVLINGTDGLVSTGASGSGALAPSGAGTKMFWNPRKAAFRAGLISGTQWDDTTIGNASVAFGFDTTASGIFSTVFGSNTTASAQISTAFGSNTTASGFNSTSFGSTTVANGAHSTAFGIANMASSYAETVLGIGATPSITSINGDTQFRTANATDRLFVIGNAIDTNANFLVDNFERSDAMIVLKNGLTRLPSTTNAMITAADGKAVVTKEFLQSNNWSLTGNTGTNTATNFLGTTDNVDLVFRRNNIQSGRIGETNTFLGTNSGIVNTGQYNTFIGERSGIANATGNDNTFIGRLAGANGTFGNDNSYLGYAAGLNNTGNGNLILGAFASQNTTGNFNVFVGNLSGSNNTTGTRNTILGYNADVGAGNLSNATAIGNLAQVNTSNSLVLGSINGVNGALVSTNVGIGTTSPATRLEIVDENTTTSNLVYGNLHVRSNNAQNIDIGGAITLGGYNDDTMVQSRVFGSVEGRKSNATTNSSSGYLSFKTNNAGTLAERIRITNAGDVGIGTTTPGGQFQLSLDEGRKPGTNTWTIVSDARLKTINGNYTKGLNEIQQLNPVWFNYKNVGERTFEKEVLDTEYPGFIAQEVQQVFPEAVGTDSDGFLNFNIHPVLIAMVNALQELNRKNQDLEQQAKKMDAINKALNDKLIEQEALLQTILNRLNALEKN